MIFAVGAMQPFLLFALSVITCQSVVQRFEQVLLARCFHGNIVKPLAPTPDRCSDAWGMGLRLRTVTCDDGSASGMPFRTP